MPRFLSANLDTNWFVPADNRNTVPRHHLSDALHEHRHTKIRALLAPIGGGKTTLLQQYYSRFPDRCAWLSLAEEDASANCFFHHLISAIRRIMPDFDGPILCHEFGDLNQDAYLFFDLFLTSLAELEQPITVIIDDLQFLSDAPWHHQLLELMIKAQNTQWIVAGNAYRVLSKDFIETKDCYLVTQDQLYFSAKEQRIFLSKNAAHQPFNQLIAQFTRGWPAGVKLAYLCLTSAAISADELALPTRKLFDFLLDKLIDHYDELTKGFLTQTAFLHRFNEELCQSYVRGGETSRSATIILNSRFLLQINPEHPLCYQYSPLIREKLLDRFARLPESERERLVASACTWLTENRFKNDGMITAAHHPHPVVQVEYYLKNIVYWLRSGNLPPLFQNQISNYNPALKKLPQSRMAWCWLMNMSGRLLESEAVLNELLEHKPIEQVLLNPENSTEANCAVAYGVIRSQQRRLDDKLVDSLKLLTKHTEVYTSLRATLNSLLAEIELNRFHTTEAEQYIKQACDTSDELNYEYNYSLAKQIEIRLHLFNNDPAQALAVARQVLDRQWQHPDGIGYSLVRITYAYLKYRGDPKSCGYQICLSECGTKLPWLHVDTQFMVYQMLVREAINHGAMDLANNLLAFLQRIAMVNGSERFNAQIHLEHFRLSVITKDRNMSDELAQKCNLQQQIQQCLLEESDYDWISRISWLMCGIYYHRNCNEMQQAKMLNQQLIYLTIQSGFSIHFLTVSLIDLWLEYCSGNRGGAYIKLNELLQKTSANELQSGLFDDIPGCEELIGSALAENRILLDAHRNALIQLGHGSREA